MQLYSGGLRENITLGGIHSSGRSVGNYNGKNLYTDFGIPDELVDIRLDRKKRGFYCGMVEKIHNPSPNRVKQFCKHFGICGGCNWQHISYPEQLNLKKQILTNALQKYNIWYDEVKDVIPSPKQKFFRNKLEYSFESEGIIASGFNSCELSGNVLGFHPVNRNDLTFNTDECYIQQHPGREIANIVNKIAIHQKLLFYNFAQKAGFLRNLVIRTNTNGESIVIIGFIYDDNNLRNAFLSEVKRNLPQNSTLMYTIVTAPEKGYADGELFLFEGEKNYLTEEIDGLQFRYGPKSFFQPNPEQAQYIYKKIYTLLNLQGNEFLIDLYTGVGTIACFLAHKCLSVLGIEGSAEAIEYANQNAKLNTLINTSFLQGDILETFNADFLGKIEMPDIIVLDPPRSGTLIEIKKTILSSGAKKLVYVSCNPVSLAYDLVMLTQGYKIKEIQPFDMFPHTHHLETVVLMEKIA